MDERFIDIHCHIGDKSFDNIRESILDKMKGEFIILNAGEEIESNKISLNLQEKYDWIKACIGLHPNQISIMNQGDIDKNLSFIEENIDKAFAISEVGLDYKNKDQSQIERQLRTLQRLFEIAEKNRKVVIVHTRKAMDDMLNLIGSFKIKVILHNFEGNMSQCEKACDMNLGISISTGFIRYKHDNIIRKVRDNLLFSETDSPALSPDENINIPLNITKIVDYIAGIRNVESNEIKALIYSNFLKIFYE